MIAATFRFSLTELWSLNAADLAFWIDQAKYINKPLP